MRSLISKFLLLAACALPAEAAPVNYQVIGDEPGPWPGILSSVGFESRAGSPVNLFVIRAGMDSPGPEWVDRVEKGAFLILEGESKTSLSFGFRPSSRRVHVSSLDDDHSPRLRLVWEHPVDLPVYEIPSGARVFARERWQGAPLVAGFRRGAGAVLWVAVTPGVHGYERFPYLLHALAGLGLEPPYRTQRLWAFFDSSYRARADTDWLARRCLKAGISALHISAWHYQEPDPARDAWLRGLIDSCHRHGILAYAWFELPHVSERFWESHPEWREKTALLQDAHLDWRKLMNLSNPDCFQAVSRDVKGLIERFDWDGVNLAELYFESLEGAANPSRFTPMNEDVRRAFERARGFDPLELFQASSPNHLSRNPRGLNEFLDFRAELAGRMQKQWIGVMEDARRSRPHLDLVLTHVDDRFDTGMRASIGADASRVLPLLESHDFTFLVEDPATLWHLGAGRYREMAGRYMPFTPRPGKLAIDINIVERYQDVYPAKQQTGTELFQLIHTAARAFPRVALYGENSLLAPDVDMVSSAAAVVDRVEEAGGKLVVSAPGGVGLRWKGNALVNGRLWPASDGTTVWLPPGSHALEPSAESPAARLLGISGDLETAASLHNGVEFTYRSSARTLARFDRRPLKVTVDGESVKPEILEAGGHFTLLLPRGQHWAIVETN